MSSLVRRACTYVHTSRYVQKLLYHPQLGFAIRLPTYLCACLYLGGSALISMWHDLEVAHAPPLPALTDRLRDKWEEGHPWMDASRAVCAILHTALFLEYLVRTRGKRRAAGRASTSHSPPAEEKANTPTSELTKPISEVHDVALPANGSAYAQPAPTTASCFLCDNTSVNADRHCPWSGFCAHSNTLELHAAFQIAVAVQLFLLVNGLLEHTARMNYTLNGQILSLTIFTALFTILIMVLQFDLIGRAARNVLLVVNRTTQTQMAAEVAEMRARVINAPRAV